MVQIYRSFSGLMPLVALIGVIGLLFGLVLLQRRTIRMGSRKQAFQTTIVDGILVANMLGVALLTLTPGHAEPRSINVVPFAEIFQVIRESSGTTAPIVEIVGNAILWVPSAVVAGLRWQRLRSFWRTIGCVAAVTACIEAVQFIAGLGRVSSISDVLLPTLGAGIALAATRLVRVLVDRLYSRRTTSI